MKCYYMGMYHGWHVSSFLKLSPLRTINMEWQTNTLKSSIESKYNCFTSLWVLTEYLTHYWTGCSFTKGLVTIHFYTRHFSCDTCVTLIHPWGSSSHIVPSSNTNPSPCGPSVPPYSNSDMGMVCNWCLMVTSTCDNYIHHKMVRYYSMHSTPNWSKMDALVIGINQ